MVKANMDIVRQNINKFMAEAGIDQKELSRRAKISYDPFNKFMNGTRTSIGLNTMLCIADALQVHPSSLIDESVKTKFELEFIGRRIELLPVKEQIKLIKALKLLVELFSGDKVSSV